MGNGDLPEKELYTAAAGCEAAVMARGDTRAKAWETHEKASRAARAAAKALTDIDSAMKRNEAEWLHAEESHASAKARAEASARARAKEEAATRARAAEADLKNKVSDLHRQVQSLKQELQSLKGK